MGWTDLKFDVRVHDFKIQAYISAVPMGSANTLHEFFDDAQGAITEYQARLTAMQQRNPDMTKEQVRQATLLKWWEDVRLEPLEPQFIQHP